jgi:TolB-like protein
MPPESMQVRDQLNRILASEGFTNSDRLSRFLRYVVERSLSGEAGQLKEYVIGREVFDRNEDYDPRLDSIVRVEAGRLRSKIDEYYNGPGREDDVVIQLRRDSYAPSFELRTTPSTVVAQPSDGVNPPVIAPRRWRLGFGVAAAMHVLAAVVVWRAGFWATGARPASPHTIAVLPFSNHTAVPADEMLAARITEGVTAELARLGTVGVVSHTSALQFAGVRRPLREIAQALDATLILEGTVSNDGGQVRVQVRLVDGTRDRKVWVEDYVGQAAEPKELERRIAQGASAAATRPRDR